MINLVLPYPPSANNYKQPNPKGHGFYLTAKAKKYHRDVAVIAATVSPYLGDVLVSVFVYRPRKQGDVENALKVAMDSLQGLAFENDSQILELHAYRRDDKDNPRLEVSISEVKP